MRWQYYFTGLSWKTKNEIKAPCKPKIIPEGTLLVEWHVYLLWDRMTIEQSTVRSRLVPRSARKLKVRVKDSQENLQTNSTQVGVRESSWTDTTHIGTRKEWKAHTHSQQDKKPSAGANEMNVAQICGIAHLQENRNLKPCSASASKLCYVRLFTHSFFPLFRNRFMVA